MLENNFFSRGMAADRHEAWNFFQRQYRIENRLAPLFKRNTVEEHYQRGRIRVTWF
ncbi:hypothetical protein IAE39_000544 [Pseudomonas sp. S37]|nr:hypothetical protein [Pseudomonas sp. S37]